MTELEQNSMSSAFDSLSDLHCKIIVSKNDLPFQWIYAVDDAWFHPAGWTLQIKDDKNHLQEAKPLFSSGEWSKEVFEVGAQKIKEPSEGGGFSSQNNPRLAAKYQAVELTQAGSLDALLKVVCNPSHLDAYTARELIKFIQKRHAEGLNYGLCFCTFEYFWTNIAAIDQPQNAVFFDIRHALADSSNLVNKKTEQESLREAWKVALEATDLFADGTGNPLVNFDMTRLGWYLHYALKFGKIGSKGAPRCDLHDNHIQIISSAINPDKGSDSGDQSTAASGTSRGPGVMSEYTEVQTAIWNAMEFKRKGGGSIDDITPDRFTFSPIPKGIALETGLAIFNNSFKDAGNWSGTQKSLFHDATALWTEAHSCGHPTKLPSDLMTREWWPENQDLALQPIKDCFQYVAPTQDETAQNYVCIKARTLKVVLEKSLVSRHFESFDVSTLDDDFLITIPSNPAIFWIATFIDFLDNLRPQDKGDGHVRVKPTLTITKNTILLTATLKLDQTGVAKLKEYYSNSTIKKGATPALLRVGKNILDMENHRFTSGKLISRKGVCCENLVYPVCTPATDPDRVQFDLINARVSLHLSI